MLGKSRNEYGSTDPALILSGIAITMIILVGTTKDYQVEFFEESLFSPGEYTKTAFSLPDGSNYEQVTIAEEDIINEQTYSSVTKDFVK